MRKLLLLVLLFPNFLFVQSVQRPQEDSDRRVVIIMLDGMRWRELFGGADSALITNQTFVRDTAELKELFAGKTRDERRSRLMPFVWSVAKDKGIMLGNRWKGSCVNVANHMHFSYPGYNETLCGFPDDEHINSNDKKYNPNVSILEIASRTNVYRNSVLAFGSWDVFPFILNEKRSGLEVNAGYRHSLASRPTASELLLNDIQDEQPRHWAGVRFDVYTFHYALEAMRSRHPKLVFIGLGETDDFAHEGRYDEYLKSAHRADQFVERLWKYTQGDPFYQGKTTFILTTDHGRGDNPSRLEEWRHHGAGIAQSGQTWFVAFGRGVTPRGEMGNTEQHYNKQVAATVAECLGIPFRQSSPATGRAIRLND